MRLVMKSAWQSVVFAGMQQEVDLYGFAGSNQDKVSGLPSAVARHPKAADNNSSLR